MTNEHEQTIGRKLRVTTLAGVLVIILAFLSVGYGITKIREQSDENTKSRIALCEIRANLAEDVARTNRLLNDNPGDIFGIPRSLIIAGRDNDRRAVTALSILDCD